MKPDSPAAQDGAIAGRYEGNEVGAGFQIASVLEWIGTCLNHSRCRETVSRKRIDPCDVDLPTRCIEVSDRRIYLRETAGQRGSYTILSHRWMDETHRSKTRTDNIEERRDGRGWGSYPQTFYDAIALTHKIGVRYIWIDSLCIIQEGDQEEDKNREIERMAEYYQNALVTFSFIQKEYTRDILDARATSPFRSVLKLPYKDRNSQHRGWFYLYNPRERSLPIFTSRIYGGELFRRGWIFQEWFLSRRIIYCTPDQLFFECQTDLPMNERRQRMMIDAQKNIAASVKKDLRHSADLDSWYHIVEMYSKTLLSELKKDHLRAIVGVAAEMQDILARISTLPEALSGLYVSGLWFVDIHYGLLWQVRPSVTVPCECEAPSWTWLSRIGKVRRDEIGAESRKGETRWLPRGQRSRPACQIVAFRDSQSRLHTLQDLRANVDSTSSSNSGDFGLTKLAIGIVLDAHMTTIEIRPLVARPAPPGDHQVSTDADIMILARETDLAVTVPEWDMPNPRLDFDENHGLHWAREWLLVCSPSTPDLIGGWALMDDLRYHDQLRSCESTALQLLHVSIRKIAGNFDKSLRFQLRGRSPGREICEVLFVEHHGGGRYRRVGMGRIFDETVVSDLKKGTLTRVELI